VPLDLVVATSKQKASNTWRFSFMGCIAQRLAEIGDPRQRRDQLVGVGLDAVRSQVSDCRLGPLLLDPKLGDPLADKLWLDALFERVDLEPDPAVEVGDLVADSTVHGSLRRVQYCLSSL